MTATNSKEPAIRQRRPVRIGCRAGWLVVLLLTATIGCAGLDKHFMARPAASTRDKPFAATQPLGHPSSATPANLRRLPDLATNESVTHAHIGADGQSPIPVQLALFQEPDAPLLGNANASGNANAGPEQVLRPVQPAPPNQQSAPGTTSTPSDALAAPADAGPPNVTASTARTDTFPIDLPTSLRLAGANNLHIALAAERVEQALATAQASRAKWLPSLNAGISYNKHDGRIQATEGKVIEANRGSLFVGGGVGLGGAPLTGGSGGPPRLFVDMSVADLLFEPLAARQMVDAAAADQATVFNQNVLEAALGYQRLVHAHALTAIRQEAVAHATRLAEITASFAQAGEGYPADEQCACAELARRQGELLEAEEAVDDASAALALGLRLDPATRLVPTDHDVVPLDLLNQNQPLESLIAQAHAARPDLESAEMLVSASSTNADLEHWRPWLPHLYAGYSGGGFGGNDNSDLKAFGDRGDFDIAAVWRLENFGFGNAARRRTTESQHRQAHLEVERLRDRIAAEVTMAFHRTHSRRRQIDVAAPQIVAANRSLELNFTGIRGGVLRPIEPQQAIGALVDARASYLNAVIQYNAAQFQLLHAIGLPVHLPEGGAAESEVVPPPVVY